MNHPVDLETTVSPLDPPPPILPQSCPSIELALTSLLIWVTQQQQGVSDLAAQPAQSRSANEKLQDSNKARR